MKRKSFIIFLPIGLSFLMVMSFMLLGIEQTERFSLAADNCVIGPHTGTLTADETWCASDSPHVVNVNFVVPSTVTLTIEPGVTVMTDSGLHDDFLIEGNLIALGTPTEPIIFTSLENTGPGEWGGLAFEGGTGHLRYVTVRYGGNRSSVSDGFVPGTVAHRGNIAINNGILTLENSTISNIVTNNYDYGLMISDSYIVMTDTLFTDIGGGTYADDEVPIRIKGKDTVLEMDNVTFADNSNERIKLDTDAMMGHDTTLTPQPGLKGYELPADFNVPITVTLTIEPGLSIMSNTKLHQNLIIEGHLDALGTPTNPITFTSVADDGPGQWAGLVFDGGTGHLRYATVRYAGDRDNVTDSGLGNWARSGISVRDVLTGELRLENVTIRDIATSEQDVGIYVENSNLVVEDSLFTGIGEGSYYTFPDTPIYIAGGDSVVTLINNTFTANNANRIVLQPDAMMNHDTSLPPQNGLEAYLLQEDLIVPPTVTLTLEPGVTLMGGISSELLVQGHLDALGTSTTPITFTSETNSAPRQWAGLIFDGSLGAGTGHLQNTTVRYSGLDNSIIDPLPGYHDGSNITVYNVQTGEVRLEHVTLESEFGSDGDYGLYINNSLISIDSSTIENNCDNDIYDSGVYITGDSYVLISNSLIQANNAPGILVEGDEAFVKVTGSLVTNNVGDGVKNTGTATVILSGDPTGGNGIYNNQGYGANQSEITGQIIATYNWWGDASGPTHVTNPGGTGEEITDRVIYDNWLTSPPDLSTPEPSIIFTFVPSYISPGDTVNFGISYQNILTETWTNTVIVADLPNEADYVSSTGGGQYWPMEHQVLWKLGDVPVGESQNLAIQVRYDWGLPLHLVTHFSANMAAENLTNQWVDLEEILAAYDDLTTVVVTDLTDQEFQDMLAGDSELNTLYQQLLGEGFAYYGGVHTVLDNTGKTTLKLVLLDTGQPNVAAYLYRDDEGTMVIKNSQSLFEAYNLDGGYQLDPETKDVVFWGEPTGAVAASLGIQCTAEDDCGYFGKDSCLRNCLVMVYQAFGMYNTFSQACASCYAGNRGACTKCANQLKNSPDPDAAEGCKHSCGDTPEQWETWQCSNGRKWGECVRTPFGLLKTRWWVCEDCKWWQDNDNPKVGVCDPGDDCRNGVCNPDCEFNCDDDNPQILAAGDPNAMYGPDVVLPGQVFTYTIEYENIGAGNAHGVYVTSQLPAGFDGDTLLVQDGGVYLEESRTFLWEVGMLAPDEGGEVQFQVQVPVDAVSSTVFVANAVVYFPSVPEVTPTNDVVTVVGNVIGYDQTVETDEGVTVPITLTGISPMANPLQFSIIQEPEGGELSGVAPTLVYTPTENFEGGDWFTFVVSDGVNTSKPAVVSIIVNTGDETIPPVILSTYPSDAATDVLVYDDVLFGDVYAPTILAYASEPIDNSTVTTDTVSLVDNTGNILNIEVNYNDYLNAIQLVLNEPLSRMRTYTVTITTDVTDTSGNPLADIYTWEFDTVSLKVYLPLMMR